MNNKKSHGNFLIILIIIVVVDALFLGYYAIQNHSKKSGNISNAETIAAVKAPVSQSENIFLK
ncbi:hypothetical protein NIE88_17160 [Sporolactobacillus shoreicorticis]|uniref:Flp pilus-assembly TadG-like N-terminal domain-containing protein n=1 Tax=Sporolactobacillus shoreicorticis TaxID=1923877 RepID=A0ABW5S248_9BACL|nr:hypothetical protein [Sporolactobacillus shoreicorticis]MCO7127489.1 hypothetical protein [Sporolactobacillus shoreicorticis]